MNWWVKVGLNPAMSEPIGSQLYKTSLNLTAPKNGKSQIGVVQQRMSPEKGTIRYATRVSLFTGEGVTRVACLRIVPFSGLILC